MWYKSDLFVPRRPMHSHPAKPVPTVAVNALWCLLIALTLLTLPIVARHARLQVNLGTHRALGGTSAVEVPTRAPAHAILLTQSEPPGSSR